MPKCSAAPRNCRSNRSYSTGTPSNSDRIVVLMRRRRSITSYWPDSVAGTENLLTLPEPDREHPSALLRATAARVCTETGCTARSWAETGKQESRSTASTKHDSGDIPAQYRVPVTGNRYAGDGSGQSPRAGIRASFRQNRKRDRPIVKASRKHSISCVYCLSVIRPMPAKVLEYPVDRSGVPWALSGKCCSSFTPPLRSLTTTTRAKYRHDFRTGRRGASVHRESNSARVRAAEAVVVGGGTRSR